MTTAASVPPHAAPPASPREQAARLHRQVMALAEYARTRAEQQNQAARPRLSLLLPFTWLFAGRAFVRDGRLRVIIGVLQTLAALFAPQPGAEAPPAPAAPAPGPAPNHNPDPWAAIAAPIPLASLLAAPATYPAGTHPRPCSLPHHPRRPARQRPPTPRLRPPTQASPRATARPHA